VSLENIEIFEKPPDLLKYSDILFISTCKIQGKSENGMRRNK
jgi:hypothetical protein